MSDAETLWINSSRDQVTRLANEFDYCTNDLLGLPFHLLPKAVVRRLVAQAEWYSPEAFEKRVRSFNGEVGE